MKTLFIVLCLSFLTTVASAKDPYHSTNLNFLARILPGSKVTVTTPSELVGTKTVYPGGKPTVVNTYSGATMTVLSTGQTFVGTFSTVQKPTP